MRRAFTLVEMLVVMALMLVLAALAIAFVPKMLENAAASRGASQLQSWLLIARQWAKRDGKPTGIRFFPDSAGHCRDLQYIQQTDPYFVGPSLIQQQVGGSPVMVGTVKSYLSPTTVAGVNFALKGWIDRTDGVTTTTVPLDFFNNPPNPQHVPLSQLQLIWSVQPGDYLQINGITKAKVLAVLQDPSDPPYPPNTPNAGQQPGTVLSLSADPGVTDKAEYYTIIRGFRMLQGEKTINLPQNIVVDLSTNLAYNNPLPPMPNGYLEVVFDPSGQLSASAGWFSPRFLCLWCRDETLIGEKSEGDQTLVTIYTRTGQIAAFPVDSGVRSSSTAAVSPGIGVTIPVVSTQGIQVGMQLVFDTNASGVQEDVLVESVGNNAIVVRSTYKSHAANAPLITDPYSFARYGSGGM